MKVKELIELLKQVDEEKEIRVVTQDHGVFRSIEVEEFDDGKVQGVWLSCYVH